MRALVVEVRILADLGQIPLHPTGWGAATNKTPEWMARRRANGFKEQTRTIRELVRNFKAGSAPGQPEVVADIRAGGQRWSARAGYDARMAGKRPRHAAAKALLGAPYGTGGMVGLVT